MLIQEMSESDCFNALTRARFGRLACAHDNQPYIVPICFVYEGPYLYGFTTLGLKVNWMRSNPLVCVELDEVEDSNQWTSIVIFGWYEELPELPATPEWDQNQRRAHEPSQPMVRPTSVNSTPGQQSRLHAIELLQQHAEWWDPGCASRIHHNPDQPLTLIFYRIRIDRTTGRRATRSPGAPVASRTSAPARESQGWLRRVFHALSKPFASRKGMEKYG
jgi:uncharacterized protein